ncbi:hypothetical protein ACT8ZV_19420 [Nocardioides sp. MAHUQ-72]|uniref:hypothetical protein n=1 Tax=unclassified Nocardioides TaxID=2615069 RepID=UPI0036167C65
MSRQQPRSVSGATWVLLGLVLLSGFTALLTVILRDDLVSSWAAGHPDSTGDLKPPAFVPVAIVLFVVFALLAGVLAVFLRSGHSWARLSLTALVGFMAVATLAGLRSDPPPLFIVLTVVSVVLDAALLFFLWHRDTSAYIRGVWLSSHPVTRR